MLRDRRHQLILGVSFAVLIIDQVTKNFARAALVGKGQLSYLGDVIRIEHAQNSGAFLSLGANLAAETRFGIFTVLVAAFLAYVTWGLFRNRSDNMSTIAMSLFIAGGIGNLIDRILYHSVTDFMNIGFGSLRTGIFNVADVAIVAGLIALFAAAVMQKRAMSKLLKPKR
jgi:signal peptidase II